jgi:hypothetical protein
MTYRTGTVYKIICTLNDIVYVGSTFQKRLRDRWSDHKSQFKRHIDGKLKKTVSTFPYFEKYGIENFKLIKIKEYVCWVENAKDTQHLRAYEQLWINKLSCVNEQPCIKFLKPKHVKRIRYATDDEYRQTIKDAQATPKYKARKNVLRRTKYADDEDYRTQILEKGKEYRREHGDDIMARRMKQIECECGLMTTRDNMARHCRSKRHQELLGIPKEYQVKQVRYESKENERRLDRVACETCGLNMRRDSLKRHYRTKHIS